nr:hypothetical protein [Roseovarius bejariae]
MVTLMQRLVLGEITAVVQRASSSSRSQFALKALPAMSAPKEISRISGAKILFHEPGRP